MNSVGVAVVATYNPGPSVLANCESAHAQGLDVVVVDDGSTSDCSVTFANLRKLGFTVIELPKNAGIAYALNRGIEHALRANADYVITLDQDTALPEGYLRHMLCALSEANTRGYSEVIVAPQKMGYFRTPRFATKNGVQIAGEPIQSGLLITESVLATTGLFDEGLFIDCVDTEFYLRARAHGIHTIIAPGAETSHAIGELVTRTIPRIFSPFRRRTIDVYEHSTFRLYYIARNRTRLFVKYAVSEPKWLSLALLLQVISMFNEIVLGLDSRARVYITLRGIWGAIRGEQGRLPEEVLIRSRRMTKRSSSAPMPREAE